MVDSLFKFYTFKTVIYTNMISLIIIFRVFIEHLTLFYI